MRIAILGSDRRYERLKGLLAARGHIIVEKNDAELVVCGENTCPRALRPTAARAWCAPAPAPEGWIDVKDGSYLVENAYLTAEGALCAVMNSLDAKISGLPCLVAGFGRVGRALAGTLACLGARVFVCSRRESARRDIEALGASCVSLYDALPFARAAFTASPVMTLDRAALEKMRKDAVITDLASAPYGVDIEAAAALGLCARREPALPGRYAPESAALALLGALERSGALDDVIERNNENRDAFADAVDAARERGDAL